MAFNRNHSPNGGILVYSWERILRQFSDVQLMFKEAAVLPAEFRGRMKGTIFQTQYQAIFLNQKKGPVHSFSMPFHLLRDVCMEQPIFGANYITGMITAEQRGGWDGSIMFKMTFFAGGAYEFYDTLKKAIAANSLVAGYNSYGAQTFTGPQQSTPQYVYYYPSPPAPGTGVYPPAPPVNYAYMSPPPYPGPPGPPPAYTQAAYTEAGYGPSRESGAQYFPESPRM